MRYSDKEVAILVGQFKSGSKVTIKILDIDHDLEIPLQTYNCYESNVIPGIYLWNTMNLDMSRIDEFNNLLYEMKDENNNTYYGKFVMGGYVDREIDLSGITDAATQEAMLKMLKIINARLP